MKKENIKALTWFVDYFANLDLENIEPDERAKLLIGAEEMLWPREELREYQDAIRSFDLPEGSRRPLAWASKIPSKESKEYWSAILDLQPMTIMLFAALSDDATEDRPFKLMPHGLGKSIWWATKEHQAGYTIKTVFAAKDQRSHVWAKILTLLDGFPEHAIRECPGCKKFFFNPTKREKRFCGNRCMWRITTAESRKADREKYNGYQRDLMTDKRREKAGLPRKRTKTRKDKGD